MTTVSHPEPKHGQITCGSLLLELQRIWDEVGESDEERDRMLLQLEQECLDVYKRKVDKAADYREQLLQSLEDSKSELRNLLSALGGKDLVCASDKSSGTIKEQLESIAPALDQLLKQKEEIIKEFNDVQSRIQKIRGEIAGNSNASDQITTPIVDENDLSLKKLGEFQVQLHELQKEKSDRLHKVNDFISVVHDLCAVLGMDFFSTISEVHPSLNDSIGVQSKSISNGTLSKLARTVLTLKEDKKLRLQKLQELASQLIDLWNLMDMPEEERYFFNHVSCNISTTVDEVTIPGALALDLLEQAEVEVDRLDRQKASKMKEIAMKKQVELEEIYARAHIEIDSVAAQERVMDIINSGKVEPSELLADMDNQIVKAKDEALSRKEILEKVAKWMSACEEESWLEDYSRDDNRYSSSRGAHLNLKRAEKARVLVNKIPVLVEMLVAKTRAWEDARGLSFTYDGVPLLAMLDEYSVLRQEREEEKRRMRDQKKFGDQLSAEQEGPFRSRPSPNRSLGPRRVASSRGNGGPSNAVPPRRLSLNQSSGGSNAKSMGKDGKQDGARMSAPANYVAFTREEASSPVTSADASSIST